MTNVPTEPLHWANNGGPSLIVTSGDSAPNLTFNTQQLRDNELPDNYVIFKFGDNPFVAQVLFTEPFDGKPSGYTANIGVYDSLAAAMMACQEYRDALLGTAYLTGSSAQLYADYKQAFNKLFG